MAEVGADIWVLTETRASVSPGEGYHGLHVPAHPTRRADTDERWVSIWSRWPVRPAGVNPDPRGSLAGIVEAPDGDIVVYGTVIPWANDPGDDGAARMWQTHYRTIERQGAEWAWLRQQYPDARMVVAGDFNQDRDGSGWYGTAHGRQLLTDALTTAGLTCGTESDVVADGQLEADHLVDHISLDQQWADEGAPTVRCWEKRDADDVRLSDHPTVAVDLMPVAARHTLRAGM